MRPSRPTIHQFAKAQFSSLGASAVDLCVTALLFRLAGLSPFWSTAIGAVSGGLLNCVVNYEWTFRGTDRTMRGVAIRYIVVWIGSILFNAWGVKLAVGLLWGGATPPLAGFMAVRIIVSIIIGIVWNFMLQKKWVYRI